MEELIILIFLFAATVVLEIKYKLVLYHSKKERVWTTLVVLIIMIAEEQLARINEIWLFPGPGMTGIYIYGLPLDLYLFYVILPYFVFVVFELIHKKMDKNR
ncbi:MAG TPA: hypothetical protein VI978_00530 [Candidatus Paceibacterota bacterium]